MSTWGTAVATIRRRTHKTATSDQDIKVAICDAIALLRRERLKWTQAEFALTLVTDSGSYGINAVGAALATKLPSDLLAIVGKRLDFDYAGLSDQRTPIDWVSREEMRALRRGSTVSAEPVFWTFWNETLELYPPSDGNTHVVRGPYIADVGTPTYSATTADPPVYTFLQPSGAAMVDDYTSPWFDQRQGFNIVTWKAEWDLWTSYWQANAGQDGRAAVKYADALAGAQDLSDLQSAGRQLRPYVPDC